MAQEARRCPQCADPVCMKGCPLQVNIPGFIRMLREGNVSDAYKIIKESNCFPSLCGRICSAECERMCVLSAEGAPIGIRALERYAADFGRIKVPNQKPVGKKVAIVGGGPAGLFAANELLQRGFQVKIFEVFDNLGGVLRYGVPDFRIPKKVLDGEINDLIAIGLEVETNCFVGKTFNFKDLFGQGFSAILLATGAGIPKFMDLKGANLVGVYYGEEFLMRVNLTKSNIFSRYVPTFIVGQKVVVVGSGNTALDCARAAVRFGRDVTVIFRRTEDEMRTKKDERTYAMQEGVKFEPLTRPIEVIADTNNAVAGVKCIKMDYADELGDGNWQLTEVPNSEFLIEADTFIIAIGHQPNNLGFLDEAGLKLTKEGLVKINDQMMTSIDNVFACGNITTSSSPLINALSSGKNAAISIDKHLK